jgi:hypothetical protein
LRVPACIGFGFGALPADLPLRSMRRWIERCARTVACAFLR